MSNRRSSILKPPKPRNPFSDLTSVLDNDMSPAVKSRRVSFASSNLIKKFATDAEKNTIFWDSTYEESLNRSDSTQNSPEVVNNDCDEDDFNCTKIDDLDISIETPLGYEGAETSFASANMDLTLTAASQQVQQIQKFQHKRQTIHFDNAEIEVTENFNYEKRQTVHYNNQEMTINEPNFRRPIRQTIHFQNTGDAEMDICAQMPPVRLTQNKRQTVHYNQSEEGDMDITISTDNQENIVPIKKRQTIHYQNDDDMDLDEDSEMTVKLPTNFQNIQKGFHSDELTRSIPSHIRLARMKGQKEIEKSHNNQMQQMKQPTVYYNQNSENCPGGDMDLIEPNHPHSIKEMQKKRQTVHYQNSEAQMDITLKVEYEPSTSKRQTINFNKNSPDGDMDLEQIHPLSVIEIQKRKRQTLHYNQNSDEAQMDVTQKISPIKQSNVKRQTIHFNQNLPDAGMEIIEQLPPNKLPEMSSSTSQTIHFNQNPDACMYMAELHPFVMQNTEQQNVYYNQNTVEGPMDMTHNVKQLEPTNSKRQTINFNRNCPDGDMDLTEQIPPVSLIEMQKKKRQTVHYQNNEAQMDMTQNMKQLESTNSKRQTINFNKNCPDGDMDLTEQIPPASLIEMQKKKRQTVHYQNNEAQMDMTQNMKQLESTNSKRQTINFNKNSPDGDMDLTEQMPPVSLIEMQKKKRQTVHYQNNEAQMDMTQNMKQLESIKSKRQTINFNKNSPDGDMDLTEQLPPTSLIEMQKKKRQTVHYQNNEAQMDMTQNMKQLEPTNSKRQTINFNRNSPDGDMDLTEQIPPASLIEMQKKKRQTVHYQNSEAQMDMTQNMKQLESTSSKRQTINFNKNSPDGDMDLTEQIPPVSLIEMQKKKRQTVHYQNNEAQMDMTQNIMQLEPTNLKRQTINFNKNSPDGEMDLTEQIPPASLIEMQKKKRQTVHYQNTEAQMDMTQNVKQLEPTNLKRQTINFNKNSPDGDMDLTEQIPPASLIEMQKKKRQTVHYQNTEAQMDMTQNVKQLEPTNLKRQTINFNRNSPDGDMDLTEQIPPVSLIEMQKKKRQTVHYLNNEAQMDMTQNMTQIESTNSKRQTINFNRNSPDGDMDLTEQLPPASLIEMQKKKRQTNYQNNEAQMDMTQNVMQLESTNSKRQTINFNKNSPDGDMTLTEQIPPESLIEMQKKKRQTVHYQNNEAQMDMTQNMKQLESTNSKRQTINFNKNSQDGDMDLTEQIPVNLVQLQKMKRQTVNYQNSNGGQKDITQAKSDHTVHFNPADGDMEITEQLPRRPTNSLLQIKPVKRRTNFYNQPETSVRNEIIDKENQNSKRLWKNMDLSRNIDKENDPQCIKRYTMHYQSNNVEMTQSKVQVSDMEFTERLPSNMDKENQQTIYYQNEMEMTHPDIQNSAIKYPEKSPNHMEKVKRQTIHYQNSADGAMDLTQYPDKENQNTPSKRQTMHYNNGEMEMTQMIKFNNEVDMELDKTNINHADIRPINYTQNNENMENESVKQANFRHLFDNIPQNNIVQVGNDNQNTSIEEDICQIISPGQHNQVDSIHYSLELTNISNKVPQTPTSFYVSQNLSKYDCTEKLVNYRVSNNISEFTQIINEPIDTETLKNHPTPNGSFIKEEILPDLKSYKQDLTIVMDSPVVTPVESEQQEIVFAQESLKNFKSESKIEIDVATPAKSVRQEKTFDKHISQITANISELLRTPNVTNKPEFSQIKEENISEILKTPVSKETIQDIGEISSCLEQKITSFLKQEISSIGGIKINITNDESDGLKRSEYSQIIQELNSAISKADQTATDRNIININVTVTPLKRVKNLSNDTDIVNAENINTNRKSCIIIDSSADDIDTNKRRNESDSDCMIVDQSHNKTNVEADEEADNSNNLSETNWNKLVSRIDQTNQFQLDSIQLSETLNLSNESHITDKLEINTSKVVEPLKLEISNELEKDNLGHPSKVKNLPKIDSILREEPKPITEFIKDNMKTDSTFKCITDKQIVREYMEQRKICWEKNFVEKKSIMIKKLEKNNDCLKIKRKKEYIKNLFERPPTVKQDAVLSLDEKIRKRSYESLWEIVELENEHMVFSFLQNTIQVKAFVDRESEIVKNVSFTKLSDGGKPFISYIHKIFDKTLSAEHVVSSCGTTYNIMSLLDYITLAVQDMVKIERELKYLQMRFGLELDSNMIVRIPFRSFSLQWLFSIEFDILKLDNVRNEDVAFAVKIGDIRQREIRNLVSDKPAGYKFLRPYIQSVNAYMETVKSRRKH